MSSHAGIRVRVGGRIRTIRIRRITGLADDAPRTSVNCAGGGGICGVTQYSVTSSSPVGATGRTLRFNVFTSGTGRHRQSAEFFAVDDPTAGTPFTLITHELDANNVRRSAFKVGSGLSGATVRTPGGVLSGRPSVTASGPPSAFVDACGKRRERITTRDATLTGGRVTARFGLLDKVTYDAATLSGYGFNLQSYRHVR